jgi:general secretion pathway protein N
MTAKTIHMPNRGRSRRTWLALACILITALVIFMPLRFAFGLSGISESGLTARSASGTIWSGRLNVARIGPLELGTLDTVLRPLPLLLGRLRFDGARTEGAPLSGSVETGWGRRAVHDLTGNLAGARLGDVPVEQLSFESLTVIFSNGRCIEASGRVRAIFGLDIAGVTLRNGMSGTARCDNGTLLLPLIGDSGLERLMLRVQGDGRYTGTLGTGSSASLLRIEGRL